MKGYMYILLCADGSYYTGSTRNLELRLQQHQNGEGANHTRKRLPVELVYYEEYQRIDEAFYREKQVQGWSRKKKEALINGDFESLSSLSIAYRDLKKVVSSASTTSKLLPSGTSTTDNELPEALEGNNTVVSSASTTDNAVPSSASTPAENSVPEVLEGTDNNRGTA